MTTLTTAAKETRTMPAANKTILLEVNKRILLEVIGAFTQGIGKQTVLGKK